MILSIRPNGNIIETCGGSNVYIEIKYNETKSCKTSEEESFFPDIDLSWENGRLGTCKDIEFNADLSHIKFEIKTKDNDHFCPGKLTFEMKNGVLFIKDNITEWNILHQGKATTTQKSVKSN